MMLVYDEHGVGFGTAKDGDVGHDLIVRVVGRSLLDVVVSFFLRHKVHVLLPIIGYKCVSSGIRLSMPSYVWCHVHPRSSISRRKLQLLGGIIDSGFRGELFSILHNFGLLPRVVRDGERYAQVVFYSAIRPQFKITNSEEKWMHRLALDWSTRGEDGFGSTGR